jgi:hypothetical protein
MPVIAQDALGGIVVQSDEPEPAALAALEPTWSTVVQSTPYALLASDGAAVTAQIAPPATLASVHAMCAAVVALARSSGIAHTLHALEGASPTAGGDLAPSFSLAPDGLQIGVKGGLLLVARLGGMSEAGGGPRTQALLAQAGDPVLSILGGVASLTWPGVERDAARVRAGVAALRALTGDASPYR